MKILFLDIDGVILSGNDLWNVDYVELLPRNRQLPQYKIDLLLQICKATDCQVVVSSTWRSDSTTQTRLIDLGVPVHEDWKTCHTWTPEDSSRGRQVSIWLANHPEVTKYVILDDDGDFYEDQPLVQTPFVTGLDEDHVKMAIQILEG